MTKFRMRTLLLSVMTGLSMQAQANMSVYPMTVEVGESGISQINITSLSPVTQYIQVDISEVLDPGTPEERENKITGSSNVHLTPQKFALSSGVRRIVRVVSIKQTEIEQTYRAYFQAIANEEFNTDAKPSTQGAVSSALGINMVWGVLIHVPPLNPKMSFEFDSRTATLSNTGNQHIRVNEIGICKKQDECVWYSASKNIYPGLKHSFTNLIVKMPTQGQVKIKYTDWLQKKSEEKNFYF